MLRPQPTRSVEWKTVLSLVGPIVLLLGFVWTASRYPDRAETNQRNRIVDDQLEAIRTQLRAHRDEQITVRVRLEDIDRAIKRAETSQDKLSDRLERFLQRRSQ